MTFRETVFRLRFWLKLLTIRFFFAWRARTIEVDEDKLIVNRGILGKERRVIPLERIQDISIKQTVKGRFFGYGDIRIETAGSGSTEVIFKSLGRVNKLKNWIQMHTTKQV